MNIYQILEELKVRKAMFLGNSYNFDSLDSFITGYMLAASKRQLQNKNCPPFGYFNTWILGHLGIKHSSFGWHWHIKERTQNDDDKAFDEFFKFLEVFKKSQLSYRSILFDKKALELYEKSDGQRSIIKKGKEFPDKRIPHKLIWEQISGSTTIWISIYNKSGKVINASWFINSTEAKKQIKSEFGFLSNEWETQY